MIRLVIADDQIQVRSALRLFLEQAGGFAVVGEADDVVAALALVAQQQPDLLIVDWELPGGGGMTVLEAVRRAAPGSRVLVLSGLPEARRAALQAGADGFVSKGDPPERFLAAVRGSWTSNPPSVTIDPALIL